MPTPEEIQAKIDEINETLDSGVTSVDNKGVRTTISHDSLRRRRSELQDQLASLESGSGQADTGPFTPLQL